MSYSKIVSLFLVLALVLATAVSASPANVYPARLRRSLFADEAGEAAGEAVGEAVFDAGEASEAGEA